MKKILIVLTFAFLLSGCGLAADQSTKSKMENLESKKEIVTNPTSSPIIQSGDVKKEIDSLTQDLDMQISELDATTDFTDTTKQDFE